MFIKKSPSKNIPFIKSKLNFNSIFIRANSGIIFTLYSEKFNLIELGFVENNLILEKKLLNYEFILLDKKAGRIQDFNLVRETLNQLGLIFIDNRYFKHTQAALRYLSLLGWPIGKSLYKQRIIRKEISHLIN